MSGLYNVIFGINPLAGALLAILDIDVHSIGRFRDCFLSEDGTEIIIYTRTGGGNREAYAAENQKLREMTGFKSDEDDGFDSTYAIFHFEVPEPCRERCKEMGPRLGVDPVRRWKETLAHIADNPIDGDQE